MGRLLAQLGLVLLVAFVVSGCGSGDGRYTKIGPEVSANVEPFEGSVISADPPLVERTDGGHSWGPNRTVFHISQKPIVEQFQVGDRVKAISYWIQLPCNCGPDEVPPLGLALIDIRIEGS